MPPGELSPRLIHCTLTYVLYTCDLCDNIHIIHVIKQTVCLPTIRYDKYVHM